MSDTVVSLSKQPKIGDIVFWYPLGQPTDGPSPAIVTQVSGTALSLTVFNVGGMSYMNACKHLSEVATERDRERNGGWAGESKLNGMKVPSPVQTQK